MLKRTRQMEKSVPEGSDMALLLDEIKSVLSEIIYSADMDLAELHQEVRQTLNQNHLLMKIHDSIS
jgi:hypothetical protein